MKITLEHDKANSAGTREEMRAAGVAESTINSFQLVRQIRSALNKEENGAPLHRLGWRDLVNRRDFYKKRAANLEEAANTEKREMTEAEAGAFDEATRQVERLDAEMDARNASGTAGAEHDPQATTQFKSGKTIVSRPGDRESDARRGNIWFRDLNTGREIRGVKHGESILAGARHVERPQAPFGEWVRSVALGRATMPELEEEMRAIITTTSGVPIPTPYAAEFIDLARAESNVIKAGAVTIPMDSKTLTFARISSDPSATWKDESGDFTASDPGLEALTLTARTVGFLVPVSEEVVADSGNFASELEKLLKRIAGAELDRVCLVGSGSGAEPQGVYGGTNVQTYNVGGTPTSYDYISHLVQLVRTANHMPTALMQHPRSAAVLDRLKDTTGQTIRPPQSWQDLTKYQTSKLPVNLESGASPNDASIDIVGDFSQLLIGMRLSGALVVSNQGYAGSVSALTRYQYLFRFVMRLDVQLAHGAAFAIGTGIND